ncbi:CBS domain-containing protein [Saccharopolyspora sp. SCSIO 74807]|uniref:CBS domain-containing protein n=1 Tax=Saccharopolyspora sp. SCSIO 74807 TaxID=3118084 RepID=UPI0030D4DF58
MLEPESTLAAVLRTTGFFRVSQLVPDDQDVMTVSVGTKVEQALDLMRRHNFDQLPVTTVDDRVIGTFTHRSLARGLRHVRAQDHPIATPVDDLVEELRFVRASQDVSEVVDFLEADHAVLVGDEDRLLAVVTTADVNRFLWHRTRPFMLLQDIELAIRGLMRSTCAANELADCVTAGLASDAPQVGNGLEDLTLSELFSVLLHGPNFGRFFRLAFGANRELVRTTLVPVQEIRNKVFHFRDEISAEELQQLSDVARWLRRKTMIRGGDR